MSELFNSELKSEKLTAEFEEQELDSFMELEAEEAQQHNEVENLVTMTDQDKKNLKQSNEFFVQNVVQNIKRQVDPDVEKPQDLATPEKEEEEGDNKNLSKIVSKGKVPRLPPNLFHNHQFRVLALAMEGSDNPVINKLGTAFKLQADMTGGFVEGLSNFANAFPKKYEALMKDTFMESETINRYNENAKDEMANTFYSSGDFTVTVGDKKPIELDLPRVVGNMAGYAAPMVGAGVATAGVASAAGLGALGTFGAIAASESALNAVITDRETGTLFNLLETFDVVEREFATKIPFYVDKDDSEIMVSLKGAGEALVMLGLPVVGVAAATKSSKMIKGAGEALVKPISNLMRKTGDVVRDSISFKHLNKNPHLIEDFVRESTFGKVSPVKKGSGTLIRDDSALKNYVVRDFITKEIDKRPVLGYLFDETGSIFNSGKKSKSLRAADQAVSEIGDSLDDAAAEAVDTFKKSVVENDIDGAKTSAASLKKNTKLQAQTKKDLDNYVEYMDGYGKMVNRLKKDSPKSYKGIQDITTESSSIHVTKSDLEDGNFLSLMGKEDSSVGDLIEVVKKEGLSKNELERVSKAFPDSDPKKITDAEVDKARQDLIKVHGHDAKAVNKLHKDGVVNLVEFTAHKQYILKQAVINAADSGELVTNFKPSANSVLDKRKLQMLQIKHQADVKGLQQVLTEFKQLRHDLGASFRLLQPKVREKMLSTVADLKAKDLLGEDTQLFLMDKILNVDDAKLNNIARKLKQAQVLVDSGEVDSLNSAFKLIERSDTVEDLAGNASKFMYNNFLGSTATAITNFGGLSFTVTADAFTDTLLRSIRPKTYYGANRIKNRAAAKSIVSILKQIEAENATNLGLMANSHFYTNLRNKDGALKSAPQVFKKAFVAGRSVTDQGSEKYGAGYTRSASKEDKAIHSNVEASATGNDEAIKGFIKRNIEDDVNELATDPGFLKSRSDKPWRTGLNAAADLHSMPLRLLNATDDAAKIGIIQRKHHRIISEKVTAKISKFSEEEMIKFRKNETKNTEKMYKKELKNLDNFEQAKIEARDPTWTTKYREGIDEPYKMGPTENWSMPVSDLVGMLEKYPVLRVLHPFTRIGLNISDYLTQHTPGIGLLNNRLRNDFMAGGYRRDKAILKQTSGVAFGKFCLYLIDKGVINGGYSNDPKMRETQIRMGYKPNSLNLNDETSIPLSRIDPLGSFCTTVADIRNMMMYHHNNEEQEKVDEGIEYLSGSVKILMETAAPGQLKDMITSISFLLSNEEVRSGAKARKVGQIVNNLTTRVTPKFLFLNPNWFKEPQKNANVEYNKDGIDFGKTFTNYLYEGTNVLFGGYLGTKPEPDLDYFGDHINRYGVPIEVTGDVYDQYTSDVWFSPASSESLFKQKKLKQRPAWKELRRLDKFIREEFESGYYKRENVEGEKTFPSSRLIPSLAPEDEGYFKGFRLLPKLPRTLPTDIPGLRVKLDNKQYNDLKKTFGGNGALLNEIEDYIKSDEYQSLENIEKAIQIRNYIHDAIHNKYDGAIKVFKDTNEGFKKHQLDLYTKYIQDMGESK